MRIEAAGFPAVADEESLGADAGRDGSLAFAAGGEEQQAKAKDKRRKKKPGGREAGGSH
jgi:hypothetical protein